VHEAVRRRLVDQVVRFRRDGRPALAWAMRLTVAATTSYVVGTILFPHTQPLLAPLTTMLVVQVTPVSLLASGLDRVLAVVSGVSLAVGFSAVVPLTWWSLGILIALCLLVGQALNLKSNLIEVAISGMLVLGVGSLGVEAAGWQRITETLVGAAVGIATNLLFPPQVASGAAGRAIDDLANAVSRLLTRAADELSRPGVRGRDVAARASGWLDDARRITHEIPTVGAALLRAEQGRKLNVRAVGTPDVGPGLRQGLEALEHSAVTIRGMFRAVRDATSDPDWPDDDRGEAVLAGLEQVLRDLAAGVDAFGELVRVEADAEQRTVRPELDRVQAALDGLHEARARLNDLVLTDTGPVLAELHTEVLAAVKRLLREMNLDERVRRQLRLRPPPRPRLSRPPGSITPRRSRPTR
jgi:hypothetical protein